MFVLFVILLQVSRALDVVVTEGVESVQMPCQVNASVSSESTVVWSREDLKYSTVHIRQQSGDDFEEQNQRYSNRTRMRTDALQTGDLSLTLMKPTVSDSETYTCTVRRFGQELDRISVPLKVKESSPLWPKVVSPVLVLLFVLAVVVCLIFYCRYQRMKLNPVYKLLLVKAAEGQQSVLLPCKTRTHLHRNATVEWRRMDIDVVVHMYPNHQELPAMQDGTYQNCTEMMENPLKTGDLSLTLSYPCHTDSGLYVCTVLKDGHKVKQKVVSLNVEEVPDVDSVSDVTDGHLGPQEIGWNWTRTRSIGDRDSLRQSLKGSVGRVFPHQQSDSSSFASESNSGVHLPLRLVKDEDGTPDFQGRLARRDEGRQQDEGDAEPDAHLQITYKRHSWV